MKAMLTAFAHGFNKAKEYEFRAMLVREAVNELSSNLNYYFGENGNDSGEITLADSKIDINYSAICENLDWPDFQDGGIFEQAIDAAIVAVSYVYGHNVAKIAAKL